MFVTFLAFLSTPLSCLVGQTTTAQIAGTISDPSGAPVPGATVTAVNSGTQRKHETASNSSGNFSIPLLPPGTYSLTIEKAGFRVVRQPEVLLQVAQNARLDFQLEVGNVSQNVTVTSQAPLLDQESSSLGQVINSKQVVDLPLNGRSPFRLVQLTPGILSVPSTNGQFSDIPVNTADDSIISINGRACQDQRYLYRWSPRHSRIRRSTHDVYPHRGCHAGIQSPEQ